MAELSGTLSSTLLSASTDGRPIAVAATSSPGTTIHTATADVGSERDQIDIYASNIDSVSRTLTLQWGGTTTADQIGPITLAANSGDVLIVVNKPLQNNLIIKAYASAANIVNVTGNVRRLTL